MKQDRNTLNQDNPLLTFLSCLIGDRTVSEPPNQLIFTHYQNTNVILDLRPDEVGPDRS